MTGLAGAPDSEGRGDTPALVVPRGKPDWDKLPRLLGDECDGPHGGGHVWTVYAFEKPNHRLWYCQGCWIKAWKAGE